VLDHYYSFFWLSVLFVAIVDGSVAVRVKRTSTKDIVTEAQAVVHQALQTQAIKNFGGYKKIWIFQLVGWRIWNFSNESLILIRNYFK